MLFIDKPRNARLEKPLGQPMQLPQPGRVKHRNQALRLTGAQHICRIGADRARRAIRQVNHQQQRTIPPLK